MAIKVQGVVVIDDDRNANAGIVTATSLDVNPSPITFSPVQAASGVSYTDKITITYNVALQKGTGNITLRDGSASGTIIETIAVSSSDVSVSLGVVSINNSNLPSGKVIFVVIDQGAFLPLDGVNGASALLDTYSFSTGPVQILSFSPADGATSQDTFTDIVLTFNQEIAKGSGNINIRAGSISGSIDQTISIASTAVTVENNGIGTATINPPNNLAGSQDNFIEIEAGAFTNPDGDAISQNAAVTTYNFTTSGLGGAIEGGVLICCSSSIYWILAPVSTEVATNWHNRASSNSSAASATGCGGWFVPTCDQLKNPGYTCNAYWDTITSNYYWSNTGKYNHPYFGVPPCGAFLVSINNGTGSPFNYHCTAAVRSFRCVSY